MPLIRCLIHNAALFIFISFQCVLVFSAPIHPALLNETYWSALKIANHSVRTPNETLNHRYQLGEWWEIAALRVDSPILLMMRGSKNQFDRLQSLAIFKFEVKEVKYGIAGSPTEILLEVKEKKTDKNINIDRQVQSVSLRFSIPFKLIEKKYKLIDARDKTERTITVSPDGVRAFFTPLEFFPLDPPALEHANQVKKEKIKIIPQELLELLEQEGVRLDRVQGQWYESIDFFGRFTEFLIEERAPWPTYLKNNQGVSILIRSGVSGGVPGGVQ